MEYLKNILLQDKPSEFIRINSEEIFKMIPELYLCEDFDQKNDWHVYDVFEHILHVVDGVPNNFNLRMAALFHDIGKPFVYEEDEKGIGHFYGHWNKSNEIFLKFIETYEIEEKDKNLISNLILYHDINVDKLTNEELDKLLKVFDREGLIMLFQLKRSDLLAQNKKFHNLLENYNKQEEKVLNKKM